VKDEREYLAATQLSQVKKREKDLMLHVLKSSEYIGMEWVGLQR